MTKPKNKVIARTIVDVAFEVELNYKGIRFSKDHLEMPDEHKTELTKRWKFLRERCENHRREAIERDSKDPESIRIMNGQAASGYAGSSATYDFCHGAGGGTRVIRSPKGMEG